MKSEQKETFQILTLDGKPQEITELGSLGLLALGYKGLIAWREKRKEVEEQNRNSTEEHSPSL